jgi:hypothetical protein
MLQEGNPIYSPARFELKHGGKGINLIPLNVFVKIELALTFKH